MHTASVHQTSLLVHTGPNIEPWRGHILIQIPPGPPFPELDPLVMRLEDLLHNLLEGDAVLRIKGSRGIFVQEKLPNFCVEDFVAIWSEEAIVLDAL